MKLTILLLTSMILQVTASSYAQKITLDEKNVALENVLKSIRTQSGYNFLYGMEALKNSAPVTVKIKNASIGEAMSVLLKNQNLSYEIKDKTIIIDLRKPSFLSKVTTLFQQIDVRGKVTDGNGKSLAGATIKIKAEAKMARTDAKGEFFLSNIVEGATLEITYVGYHSREIKATETMRISLTEDIGSLNEIVVNKGYYTESQKLSTGSTVSITSKDIEKQPVLNPLLALQGRATGVQITQNTGVANGSVNILIRGRASLNAAVKNDPLYVIDGVPFQSQLLVDFQGNSGGTSNDASPGGNPLNYINPNDIERMDVLKDADATAIYGSRGGNGVILITTKKGKPGNMTLGTNVQQGFMQAPAPLKLMSTTQYLNMRREAFTNDGVTIPNIANNPNDPNYDVNGLWSQTSETDWQEELLNNFAAYTNLNLSLSGGTEALRLSIRGTVNRQGSLFPGDFNDTRGAIAFNLNTASANKKFKLDFSGNYLKDNNQNTQNDLSSATLRAPNAPESFLADGTLNFGGVNADNANNPYVNTVRTYSNKTDNLNMSVRPSILIAKGLLASANLGFTKLSANINNIFPAASYSPLALASGTTASRTETSNQQSTWIVEPQLSYETKISRIKLNALIGGSFQKSNNVGLLLIGSNFISDALLGAIRNAGTLTPGEPGSYKYNYNAIFGRVNANLDDKYVLNVTGRRDGSSRFGPGNQFGNFYSVGAAWIFSSTKFVENQLPFLSLGKLRGSYGTSGNDGIGNYAYYDLYGRRANTYQGSVGFAPLALSNPNVAWDQSAKMELATDLGFMMDRIVFSASYYRNRSSNQLIAFSVPAHVGFPNIASYNFPATVQNSGWEFNLSTTNITKGSFSWNSSFNISINRNKLIEFRNLANSAYATTLEIGKPVSGRSKAYIYKGVDPQTGIYTFLRQNGTIGSDVSPAGPIALNNTFAYEWITTIPEFFGGLNNSLTYKGLQLDFFFQFVKQTGKQSLLQSAPGLFSSSLSASNVSVELLDRWQKPGDPAKYQRYTQAGPGVFAQLGWNNSDVAFVDASFIRLKNINLAYQLPAEWRQKLKLKNCVVNLTAQNLLTITPYKGRDPETQAFGTLPPLKVILVGLQFNL